MYKIYFNLPINVQQDVFNFVKEYNLLRYSTKNGYENILSDDIDILLLLFMIMFGHVIVDASSIKKHYNDKFKKLNIECYKDTINKNIIKVYSLTRTYEYKFIIDFVTQNTIHSCFYSKCNKFLLLYFKDDGEYNKVVEYLKQNRKYYLL
jgi:hypothetical protein